MKKGIAMLLAGLLCIQSVPVYALTDSLIFTDPVSNTYTGVATAGTTIENLNFSDLGNGHWAKEAIARTGALGIIKGYDTLYLPSAPVTNGEAVAFAVRAIGRDADAQAAAVALEGQGAANGLMEQWYLGYLYVALEAGMISQADYTSAVNGGGDFSVNATVTREKAADLLYKGIQSVSETYGTSTYQSIYKYADWENISVAYVPAVEALSIANIMTGDDGRFYPKGIITRAEMAQVLRNMDSIYYSAMNYVEKNGTVGGFNDLQRTQTGGANLTHSAYIRTASGAIDVINYMASKNSSPQASTLDVVVYKNGEIGGMELLQEGDEIQYIVDTQASRVLYIQVTKILEVVEREMEGILKYLDVGTGSITIYDDTGKEFQYNMVSGLYGSDGTDSFFVYIDEQKRNIKNLPLGSRVALRLKNNTVDDIRYIGEVAVYSEMRGVVIENNADFGYIVFIDNNGNKVTKYYYENDLMTVKKRQYYDIEDEVGYIDQVFPYFKYNPMNTVISDIEAGDIVFVRLDPDNQEAITDISASSNYIMKYGKIRQFQNHDLYSEMLIEYENGQTAWLDVPYSVFVSADGYPKTLSDVVVGDWAKILVNQAIIEPGYVMESVKELVLEGNEHFISTIIRGQLVGINQIQNQLMIQNAQTLTKTGWSNYKEVEQFNLASNQIEYYFEGQRISLDYALRNLKRSNGEVYIALENNYAGEQVRKVTFRNGRDELLNPDTVIHSDGNGNFNIMSNNGSIATDEGTIVRRHGRLVDGQNIMIPDYAVVVLNGENKAAVVDIVDAPDVSGVVLARGRIQSVDDGKSFKVQSMALLTGQEWTYTPIQREFTIDYNTLFLGPDGYVSQESFISYTDASVVDKVYTIVVDGSRAAMVIEAPYAKSMVRGTIYQVNGDEVLIKDATYYNSTSGKWVTISNVNSTASVGAVANSVIVKSNRTIRYQDLTVGDQIRIMTDTLPEDMGPGLSVDGYIILVEK